MQLESKRHEFYLRMRMRIAKWFGGQVDGSNRPNLWCKKHVNSLNHVLGRVPLKPLDRKDRTAS
jgi:hypothetical protein